jgi:hypothetical protein
VIYYSANESIVAIAQLCIIDICTSLYDRAEIQHSVALSTYALSLNCEKSHQEQTNGWGMGEGGVLTGDTHFVLFVCVFCVFLHVCV